jgi:hypothetical protein
MAFANESLNAVSIATTGSAAATVTAIGTGIAKAGSGARTAITIGAIAMMTTIETKERKAALGQIPAYHW